MQGPLKKMNTNLRNVVEYTLNIDSKSQFMNDLIGKYIKFDWGGQVICMCGRVMKSFYRSGFCYKCYWEAPQASPSIFKPELCTAHLDIEERDLNWEKDFQISPHYVYLANSSGIKVGITRKPQKLTRWMDQGASQAIILAEVPNRRFSGDIEIILKNFVSDVTNWRKMLSRKPEPIDLVKMKNELLQHIPEELKDYITLDNTVTEIQYPVDEYPTKVKSMRFDNNTIISGELRGIKGQYLILDKGVLNIRSHEGYIVNFSFKDVNPQVRLF